MAADPDEPHPLGRLPAGVDAGDIAVGRRRSTGRHRSRLPCWATCPARSVTDSRIARPAVRRGWLRRRARPERPARRRRVRRGVVGRAHRTARRRTAPRRRHPRQRGDLRRLLRLGQRGSVPPRAESGAPIPQTAWRVHLFAALLQSRRHRRDHAAGGRHPRRPVQALDELGRSSSNTPICWCASAALGAEEHRASTTAAPRPIRPATHCPVPRPRRPHRVVQSPLRDDVDGDCEWLAPVPGTDVAIMLALAHVLATESLADRDFLDHLLHRLRPLRALPARRRRRRPEVAGVGVERSAGCRPTRCVALARRMAAGRTIVTVSWSLQRIRHGEQAPWMGLTLAAMLGQIGLPGGGFGHGYGSMNEPGLPPLRCRLPALPQGLNPVADVHPGGGGQRHAAAPRRAVRLQRAATDLSRTSSCVYWAGGNPFHHHQNIPRLRRALGRVDTVVVHDPYWTAMAKHADIVVPSTTAYERDDYSGSRNDPLLMAMPALTEPYARVPRRLHDIRRTGAPARLRRAVHRGPHRPGVAGAHLRQVGRRTGFRGADVRRVLGGRAAATADPRTA